MLEIIRSEAKTNELALQKGLEELNITENEVYYFYEETEGSLFKGKKAVAVITTKYAVKDYIKGFLNELASKMGTKFNFEIKETEYGFSVLIVTEDSAAVIGRDGRTLNSIQIVLRQALKKYGRFNLKVNIDICNYKAKKERNIGYEVKNICREVLKTKVDAKLDSMNSYERRVVHTVVGEFKNLETVSEGEAPNRYVVIKYKGD
jgi:spoIIIJ-associated protein